MGAFSLFTIFNKYKSFIGLDYLFIIFYNHKLYIIVEKNMKDTVGPLREFYNSGETLSIKFRIEQLKALKKSLIKYDAALLQALHDDLNKSSYEAIITETGIVMDEINFYIKNLKKLAKPKKVKVPVTLQPGKSYIHYEPYGVVLIISPWNYPVQLTLCPLIAAIAAGNCAVLKLSEYSENTSLIISQLINETFPREYVKPIRGDAVTGAALLLERFDYIFFTGNQNVGKIVMKSASTNLTPVTLELGGKSPCIIDSSADIKDAAKKIIWGKSLNAGQTCVAPDYILCHSRVKKDLISALIAESSLVNGAHSSENDAFPKIISKKHFERAVRLIDSSKVVFGGLVDMQKLKIDLTIMDNVTYSDRVMQEEIFAPVLPVIEYTNIDDVINQFKSLDKPLALYIFASDKSLIKKVIENISFGGGAVNDLMVHITNNYAPFGGVGASGMGAYHGKYSFDTFSHKKHIYQKYSFFDNDLRFSPNSRKEKLVRFWFYR